jgi:hypothetical protein
MNGKEELLKQAGYRYNFDRMVYINRDARKIFSVEAIEDKPEEWLIEKIAEKNDDGEWQFFFNEAPSPAVRRDFLAELDERRAAS